MAITLSGTLERVRFRNDENGFTIVLVKPDAEATHADASGLVVVCGTLPVIEPGEYVRVTGEWTNHARFGWQVQASVVERVMPTDLDALSAYLGSGIIEGIGPAIAGRIVAHFGADTLRVIDEMPEHLAEVPGVGEKRSTEIATAWRERAAMNATMIFLSGCGVTPAYAKRIWEEYGVEAVAVIQANPYRLARDVDGIGFKKADGIAENLGIAKDSPFRIEAGLLHVLDEMVSEGHTYAPRDVLLARAAEVLELTIERVQPQIASLEGRGIVVEDLGLIGGTGIACYCSWLHQCETQAAQRLAELARAYRAPKVSTNLGIDSLTPAQAQAVEIALRNPVSILTGGPGTGKTYTVQALIRLAEANNWRYALCAPTGRAAKRISEVTGRSASTIHKLIEYQPGGDPGRDGDRPLDVEMLIVDEVSMVDTVLAFYLFSAIRPGTTVVLVGDEFQLPSVGAGNVLADLIKSGLVPATHLTQIHRQAEGSMIVRAAHSVHNGKLPTMDNRGDFRFVTADAANAERIALDLVCRTIPGQFNIKSSETQVIAPMYRGSAGIDALNLALQATLNPSSPLKPERKVFERVFRVGDRVLQTKNNYDLQVVNGDLGTIAHLDPKSNVVVVRYADRDVQYGWTDATAQLVHAFAMSVHKSQGSEFRAVVMVLLTQHYMMLQRNLLYTAITRARDLCILVGDPKALAMAVGNNAIAKRWTALDLRLG